MESYAKKLIDNIPPLNTKHCFDLVLDGGAFNGSYLVGALHFLKEMERKDMIEIKRISGCSIGSFVAFLYLSNQLNFMDNFTTFAMNELKQTFFLKRSKEKLREIVASLDPSFYKTLNKKLYICYYNVVTLKKHVQCTFISNEDIVEAITKSSFLPFCIDESICYSNKYVDGVFPYIFQKQKGREILHLNLAGFDKISNVFKVKNERNTYTRMLTGLLEIQNFFIANSSTSMCSLVAQWSMIQKMEHFVRYVAEKVFIILVYFLRKGEKKWKQSLMFQLFSKIWREIYIYLLKSYCL